MSRYPAGQPVRISTTIRDTTGALVDAGTLTLVVKLAAADGTLSTTGTYTTPTHDSTGTYHQDVPAADLTGLGHYQYAWTAAGAGAGVSYGDFDVFDPFEPEGSLYCTIEELKSRLAIGDTGDDPELTLAVEAASRSVDEICRRYFWQGTDTRTYIPAGLWGQQLDDIVSVTTFKTDYDGDGVYETTWTLGTDYALTVSPGHYNTGARGEQWPYTGFTVLGPKFIPYTWMWSHLDRIQVTGVFGWPAVPVAVKQATLIAATDLFKLKDAPFGVLGSPDLGVVRIGQNSRVMSLLNRYVSGQRVGV